MPLRRALLVNGGDKISTPKYSLTFLEWPELHSSESGTPLGDVLLAGIRTGAVEDFKVVNEWLEDTEITKQNIRNKKLYDEYYNLFREIHEANREIYENLRKLQSGT